MNTSADELRSRMVQLMRHTAHPVHVVVAGTDEPGHEAAVTVTSVSCITMDPPTMLCCIQAHTMIAQIIERSGRFSINALSSQAQQVSEACAGGVAGAERARVLRIRREEGTPYLEAARTSMLCDCVQTHRFGSHLVFVGQVTRLLDSEGGALVQPPLLYMDRQYGTFQPSAVSA